MTAMIQVTETERTWDAAYAVLVGLHEQDGFVCGKLRGRLGRWTVLALFEAPMAYEPGGWLPDGMRFVFVPESFLRAFTA